MSGAQLVWWEGDEHCGQATLIPGHNLQPEVLDGIMTEWFGPGEYGSAEVWANRMPRVKWCERYDGWGCDNSGDWHAHWYQVRPNPDTPSIKWTLLWEAE